MIPFTTLILAGGRSRRMGRDKALVPFRERPLIEYPLDLARSLNSPVILSANSAYLDHLGVEAVHDILPVNAPLAGVHAGLSASRTDWNLVLTCDMPNLPVSLILRMTELLDDTVRLILPRNGDFVEPLCGFWHRALIPEVENQAANGNLKLLDLLPRAPHRILSLDEVAEEVLREWFRNVNDRSDLEE